MTAAQTKTKDPEVLAPADDFPYLCKTQLTFVRTNDKSGVEEKITEEVIFQMTLDGAKMPQYVLRNYSVPRYLNEKYGPEGMGWLRIYEHKIIQLMNRLDPSDIAYIPLRVMTFDQLDLYSQRWELNVNVHEFHDIGIAREMVRLRQADEKAFKIQLEDYRTGKKRAYPELDKDRSNTNPVQDLSDEFTKLTNKPKNAKPYTEKAKKEILKNSAQVLNRDPKDVTEDSDGKTYSNPFGNI